MPRGSLRRDDQDARFGTSLSLSMTGRVDTRRNVSASAKKKGGKKADADDAIDDDGELDVDEDFDDAELAEIEESGEEEIETDDVFFTAGTEWGQTGLDVLKEVLGDDEFGGELEIFSYKVSAERKRIYISIDAVNDKFGSPTLDQLGAVSRSYNNVLEEKGFPDDVALEVASPGAERQLRLPHELERFRDLTMKVTYAASAEEEGAEGTLTKVLDVENIDADGSPTFKLADVEENRPQAKKGQGMNYSASILMATDER
jgi:ribosome maturation factor RimP